MAEPVSSSGAGPNPSRARGGFRYDEIRTIPKNVTEIKVPPKTREQFKRCRILTNYVPIVRKGEAKFQMYRVDFAPELESASLMRKLYRAAAGQKFARAPMYDGVHECRSQETLPEKVTIAEVAESVNNVSQVYTVTFTHTGETVMGNEMIRTYNIHMKEFLRSLGYYQPQPGLHVHPNQFTEVGPDIFMLAGFRTAANLHDNQKLLMNFEGAHKLVQRNSVLKFMRDILSREQARGGDYREAIKSELRGKLIVTSYNKRAYRVEDVDFEINPTHSFNGRDGQPISFLNYYKNRYECEVTDRRQPMLICVPSNQRRRGDEEQGREMKLVPEFCNLAGLTEDQRNDFRLKRDLIQASQIAPSVRVSQLRRFLETFHNKPEIQQQLNSWGYTYEKDLLQIEGILYPETKYASGRLVNEPKNNWTPVTRDDFRIDSLAVMPASAKFAVIFSPETQPFGRLMNVLKAGFDSIGWRFDNSLFNIIQLDGGRADQYGTAIRNIRDVSCAIVVMKNQNKTTYDTVKKAASVNMGLVTQVVTAKLLTDERKARGAATKIAIQIAAKIGGEPWHVDIPLSDTMICGYDTHHDTTMGGRSFGAFTASMNNAYSKWFSKADDHGRLEEMSSHIATNVIEALSAYQVIQKKLPMRIIIYRDGVGEGQIAQVFEKELKMIIEKLDALSAQNKSPRIMLSMIIVNKRIGARFYLQDDKNFINPPPGTAIDSGPTRDGRFDFFLISQSTRQGTVTPTYYNIIHDECRFTAEIHQRLALKLCYLYYNWAGSVRVPAPCQYAHKLAYLCGEHLHTQPHAALQNRLHFL